MKNFSEKNSPSFVNKPVKNIKIILSLSNTNSRNLNENKTLDKNQYEREVSNFIFLKFYLSKIK